MLIKYLIPFIGAIVNMFFMNRKTMYLIQGKNNRAIFSATMATLIFMGVINGDWITASIFAIGNSVGMYVSIKTMKDKFKDRIYTVTPPSIEESIKFADKLRDARMTVTTKPSWFGGGVESFEIVVLVTNEEGKSIVKQNIPLYSEVMCTESKFGVPSWMEMIE